MQEKPSIGLQCLVANLGEEDLYRLIVLLGKNRETNDLVI